MMKYRYLYLNVFTGHHFAMKKILCFFITLLGFFLNVQAQAKKTKIRIIVPTQLSEKIFNTNSGLSTINISYLEDGAKIVRIQHNGTPNDIEEFFLDFEGDRFLLNKKYPEIDLPDPANLLIDDLSGIESLKDIVEVKRTTTIMRDSTIYSFYINPAGNPDRESISQDRNAIIVSASGKLGQTDTRDTVYTLHPKPKSSFSKLERKLELDFRHSNLKSFVDSAILVSGIVETDGTFSNIGLAVGEPSRFSDRIIEIIKGEPLSWYPRVTHTQKKVRQLTKIFVRLNPDRTFTVLTY